MFKVCFQLIFLQDDGQFWFGSYISYVPDARFQTHPENFWNNQESKNGVFLAFNNVKHYNVQKLNPLLLLLFRFLPGEEREKGNDGNKV